MYFQARSCLVHVGLDEAPGVLVPALSLVTLFVHGIGTSKVSSLCYLYFNSIMGKF